MLSDRIEVFKMAVGSGHQGQRMSDILYFDIRSNRLQWVKFCFCIG
jgi:hypothetical protein